MARGVREGERKRDEAEDNYLPWMTWHPAGPPPLFSVVGVPESFFLTVQVLGIFRVVADVPTTWAHAAAQWEFLSNVLTKSSPPLGQALEPS